MDKLYAPWRDEYIVCKDKDKKTVAPACVFCLPDKQNDVANGHNLKKFKHTTVLLNLYPYTAGHLLVIPQHHHVKFLHELPDQVLSEMMLLTSKSVQILQKVLCAEGVNIGMNLGASAGAGIPGHLHMHIVPRWHGDTNFMPVIGKTKQISIDLERIHEVLLPEFEKLTLE